MTRRATFIARLQARANQTVTAKKVTVNSRGEISSTDETISLTNCRIEDGPKLVTDSTGREVVSMYRVHSMENNNLWLGRNASSQEWRFTLPTSYYPTAQPDVPAKSLDRHSDDIGVLFEEIYL